MYPDCARFTNTLPVFAPPVPCFQMRGETSEFGRVSVRGLFNGGDKDEDEEEEEEEEGVGMFMIERDGGNEEEEERKGEGVGVFMIETDTVESEDIPKYLRFVVVG